MKISLKLFSLIAVYLLASSCSSDEDVSAPPASTITVNATTGLVGDTEFTFTVTAADASAVTILPKGEENSGKAGILVSKSQFAGGATTTVKYTYDEPGTFAPVVVTTNYSLDGKSVKRTVSAPLSVTITSNKAAITEFTMDKSTKTTITEGAGTIVVELPYDPYGKANGLTAVKASFKASGFSTVKVGGTTQESGVTANNFTSPVAYTVTAQNGTTSKTYTVSVVVAPVETDNTVKTFSAKSIAKSNKDRVINASVDNTGKKLVLYDIKGTAANAFDSLRISYELNGKLATASLKQDSLLNLSTSTKPFTVTAQNATTGAYTIYALDAPELKISFEGLVPAAPGETKDFGINVNVLKGTTITSLVTTAVVTVPPAPAGITYTIKADGAAFTSGVTALDFSNEVKFELTVTDPRIGGGTYTVVYTAKVTVLP